MLKFFFGTVVSSSALGRLRCLAPFLFACGLCHASLSTNVSGLAYLPLLVCPLQTGTSNTSCSSGPLNLTATADYGNLSATSSITSGFPTIEIYANSSFTDTLTIDTPGASSGFVDFSFLLTGQASSSDLGLYVTAQQNGSAIFSYSPYVYPGSNIGRPTGPPSFPGGTFVSIEAPFTSSTPFSFGMALSVDTFFYEDPSERAYTYGVTDTGQFSLTGISVFDANGQPITSGTTIHSDSSTYGGLVIDDSPTTATPEPSLGAVLLVGLVGLMYARFLRAKKISAGRGWEGPPGQKAGDSR